MKYNNINYAQKLGREVSINKNQINTRILTGNPGFNNQSLIISTEIRT